jgi:hypothetical protein
MLGDYFGCEAETIRFLRSFAGIVLRIPPMPMVERTARDRQIARSLKADPTTATVRRLARLHSVPVRSIAKSFLRATGEGLREVRSGGHAGKSKPRRSTLGRLSDFVGPSDHS